jgi:hypothetical protein
VSYTDLVVLQSRLNEQNPDLAPVIQASADWADAFINAYTHRSFVATRQTRYFGPDALDTSPLPYTPRGGLDYTDPLLRRVGWSQWPYRRIYMDTDLLTIYSVTNGDGTSIPSNGYYAEPRNETPHYSIWLNSAYSWVWDTDGWIAVDADWGYSQTAGPIIAGCAYRLAEYHYRAQVPLSQHQPLWRNVQGKGTQMPEGFPNEVLEILDPYIRLTR